MESLRLTSCDFREQIKKFRFQNGLSQRPVSFSFFFIILNCFLLWPFWRWLVCNSNSNPIEWSCWYLSRKKHVDIFKKLFNVEEFIWTVSCLRNWRFLFCVSTYKYWCFIFGYYFRKILIEILKYIIDYKIRSTYFHRRRKISSQRTESKIIYISKIRLIQHAWSLIKEHIVNHIVNHGTQSFGVQ